MGGITRSSRNRAGFLPQLVYFTVTKSQQSIQSKEFEAGKFTPRGTQISIPLIGNDLEVENQEPTQVTQALQVNAL